MYIVELKLHSLVTNRWQYKKEKAANRRKIALERNKRYD
jgi:hypothetical protein